MSWEVVIFFLIAGVSVLAAAGMVVATNPIHSAIFLVLSFLNVAAIFVMLGAEFLAVVQVIVYTGAIMVLMLFVLMLVDPDDLPEFHTARPVQRYVGLLLGLILLLEVGIAIIDRTVLGAGGGATPLMVESVGGNAQALGRTLYTEYLLPFEIVSLVLTVGVIGSIVLALPERLGERVRLRRDTISLGHAKGVDLALSSGTFGETPIESMAPTLKTTSGGGREIILVKDPDAYTTIDHRG